MTNDDTQESTNDESKESDQESPSDKDQENNRRGEEEHSGTLEKIISISSLILILGITGYLAWESIQDNTPPALDVTLAEPRQQGEFVAIVVAVQNSDDDTAKAVQVRGEAPGADGKPAEAEATMDWLPGQSKRRVTLLFPTDANVSQADVKVVGYEEP